MKLLVALTLLLCASAQAETLAIICTAGTTPQNCSAWKYDVPVATDKVRVGSSWADFALKAFSAVAPAETVDACVSPGVPRDTSTKPIDPCKDWAVVRADSFATTPSLPLSWDQSLSRMDGTSMTNLSGFRIVYGTSAAALTQIVQIPDPAARSYTLSNLAFSTNYFLAVKAYDSDGIESDKSNTIQRTTIAKPAGPKAKPVPPIAK